MRTINAVTCIQDAIHFTLIDIFHKCKFTANTSFSLLKDLKQIALHLQYIFEFYLSEKVENH